MIIKVCGMREAGNIAEVAGLGIDWMGFIFYPKSPRYVLKEDATKCCLEELNGAFKKVGVFVNEPVEQLQKVADHYSLNYIQLHGIESPAVCSLLKQAGYNIIKVFSVASEADLERVPAYEGKADFFLFDTKCKEYGGSGKKFDWSVLEAYTGKTPFLLSGGINPESVDSILSFSHPLLVGVDLNSGFEIAPARKDTGLLAPFITQIRELKNK